MAEEENIPWSSQPDMKARLYLGQHESLRIKRVKLVDPQMAEISIVQKEVKGVKFNAVANALKTVTPEVKTRKQARMSSHGIPAELVPELIARRSRSAGSISTHHLDFWGERQDDGASSSSVTIDSWNPLRGSASPKESGSISPRGSHKRPMSCSAVSWKSKRGRFAEGVEAEVQPNYEWMPFLRLLKENPDYPEFVYLQPPVVSAGAFDPYELEIVSHSELNSPYYYTMSGAGVTLFRDSDAEFSGLHEWEQEYASYRCVMKLNVFRQYKQWKSFAIWRHFVRKKVQGQSKKGLRKQLFTVNVVLQKVLLRIRAMLVVIMEDRFYIVENEQPWTLAKFLQVQETRRDELTRRLQQLASDVIATLREGCNESLDMIDEEIMGRAHTESDSPPPTGEGGAAAAPKRRSSATKLASVAAKWKMDKEKQMEEKENQERFTFAIAAAKRNQKFRLLNFLRLVDYMIADTIRSIFLKSLNDFVYRVAHHTVKHQYPPPEVYVPLLSRKQKEGMAIVPEKKPPLSVTVFEVDLVLEAQEILLEPSYSTFEQKFEQQQKSIARRIKAIRRLIYVPELDEVVEKGNMEVGDNPSTYMDLIGDKQPAGLVAAVNSSMNLVFQDGETKKMEYQPFLEIFKQNAGFSIEVMEQQLKEKQRDIETFRSDLDVFLKQIHDINSISDNIDVGILFISNVRLKNSLLPSPQRTLQAIFTILPQLGARLYQDFIGEIHTATKKLLVKPLKVDDFVEIARFLQTMQEKADYNEERFNRIKSYYQLMDEYKVPVPELENASYQMMAADFIACKDAMVSAEEGKVDNVKIFSAELLKQIEDIKVEITAIKQAAQDDMILNDNSEMEVVLGYVRKLSKDVQAQKAHFQKMNDYQKIFQVDETRWDELADVVDEVEMKHSLWSALEDLGIKSQLWASVHFEKLDVEELEEIITKYAKLAVKLERGLLPNKVVGRLRKIVDEFRLTLPVIQNLRNKALKDRHYKKIEGELGQKLVRDATFTLGKLLDLKVMEHKAAIGNISNEATQEAALEELLQKVQNKWTTVEFVIKPYKEMKEVYVLGGVDDVISALEDSMVTMNTVTSSRYVAGIRNEVEKLENQLKHFGKVLDEWMECQKQWMYLESIFSAPDIQRQLPNESKAFIAVDKQYKEIMKRTHDRPNALQAGCAPIILETFQKSNETLEKIQKNLEDYLETKRMSFPRFYFLSNDELLEILAQTRNVQAVQPHMSKCFDGIRKLDFGEDPKSIDIYAMLSSEGERILLGKNLKARGNVENWLTAVEQNMVSSLRRMAKIAHLDYAKKERKVWVLKHPAQLVIMISSVYWRHGVESCLTSQDVETGLSKYKDVCIRQLEDLSELVRGQLQPLERKILTALITIDVHARDIVEDMLSNKIFKFSDFGWQMQLRYYWDDTLDDCVVRQTNARFIYAYEYLGAQARLVITPLTDRCYMTLTGALHLKLGGAPAGPAGTGKTETTKDLGKALGIQCVVFNCGDNLDYKFMGKFFAGLSQCGAWACFDEFNRIDIEVLSVVAQQLLTIQNALKAGLSRFNFEGREIKLVPTCGVFITMNPGYAGRTELPDNLKVLFRPVSMMIPDYALVAEVMLFSEGFANAKILSRKMVKLYKLSSEQLSQQDHYDFGMRAVKSVLVMAGSLKRANPTLDEDVVLIRAFKDSNLPKFLAQDVHLFLAIISDLFPGVFIPRQDFGDLQTAVESCLLSAGLQTVPAYVIKVIQLYETMNVRFGVMLVGPTGGGKSACYKTLEAAMTKLRTSKHANQSYQICHSYVLNPKCIKMGELYGEYNLLTNEWTDGLASTIMRQCVADTSQDRKWVVFDGPVDAIWIENMNTVLDDNCILCLPNGERIKLNPTTMRMLFEVQDLSVASPATVSRCGMVYVPPEELGWRPYVQSWMQRLSKAFGTTEPIPQPARDHLWTLFDTYVDIGLKFLRQECKENIPSVNINLVTSLCHYLQALCHPSRTLNLKAVPDILGPALNKIFAFSFVWAIGGNINHVCLDKFDAFFRAELEVLAAFPGGGSVFEFFVSMKEITFAPWDDIVPKFKFIPGAPFFTLMVPTQDSTRMSYLMEVNLEVERGVLYQGVSGVGKSAIVYDLLNRLREVKNYMSIVLNFSAQTTSIATQETIESKLEKKRRTRYGAPIGKKIVLFVDDVNMPAREKYGAQPPIELLRQFQDFRGFYDRVLLFWKDIDDMTIVAACAPPGGGRNEVTPRFFRHFTMVCVQPPSETCLRTIFGAILGGFLQLFASECKTLLKAIVDCTIEVYVRMSQELLPTPTKSHYTFNLRDVSKVFQGILMVKPADCNTKKALRGLWVHECMRVFHDRLINSEDKNYFTQMIHDLLKRSFEESGTYKEVFEDNIIMYGDYLRPGVAAEDRRYELVADTKKLPQLFKDYLEDYNMSTTQVMKLVFFKDAIDHISRIARVLRQPRGNAMLVGVGGSGKQSLTRFAAFLCEYKCFQIELKKGYNLNDFREDLKKLYKIAGVEGTPVVFLFTDTQIVNEGFVEDINNLLNSGEVSGLYASDEKDRIGAEMREYVSQLGLPETKDVLYSSFIHRTRDNLHVVLCMSPIGDAFRARCRQFPSLINCCTIDWFNEWPHEALLSVSNHFLAPVDLSSDEIRAKVAKICVEIHMSVSEAADKFYAELRRKYYITPKSYLDCVNLYIQLLADKRQESYIAQDRFLNGLYKLKETNDMIDGMKLDLGKLQPILAEKAQATNKLLAQVARDQESAQLVKDTVQKEEAEVKSQAEATQIIKDDAQKDLDAALPALNASVQALNSLNKNDITEIKSFTKPPPLVLLTMEGVCVLLGEKPDWDTSKKVMSDVQFIKRLIDYNKDAITPLIQKKLVRYIEDPSFLPEIVQKQSAAATSLCMWVRAMDVYAKVAKVVAPKKETLRQAEAALKLSAEKLASKQKELSDVESQVAELQRNLAATEAEQKALQDQALLTENRLIRAGKLTSALADEAVRWNETAEDIANKRVMFVGDVFICSACISYYGAFSGPYREELVDKWVSRCQEEEIPVSANCTLRSVLSTPVEVREWSIWGLPTDDVSVDNGILVTRGKRWPLMIDPQGQANSWIKAMESKNGLRVLRLNDPTLLRTLESCIRIGNPVLLEEIGDTIDPSLEPVLQKQIFEKKGRFLIRLGDSDVDYDPNFKLYMTTKMSNPHYMPDVCIKVTLVNFTVTMKGLEDQLLGDVVRKERADLEEQNDRLVVSISSDKKQLKDLEDKILKLLKESEGNILDDEVLINTLNTSKVTSAVIQKRVKQAEVTEKEITAARELYRVVANRGSILYFVISDLALIDSMYQYSLSFFSQLFGRCIEISEKSDELDIRLAILIKFITEFLYANVSRGLFEAHKVTFSFLIATSILRYAGEVRPQEWNFFLRGNATPPPPNRLPNPSIDAISPKMWHELCSIEELSRETFTGLTKEFTDNFSEWKAFLKCPEPHSTPFPSGWDEKMDAFQRVIMMKILREEKLVFAIETYIKLKLGPSFIGTSPLQLEEVFKDTTNTTPVIFILSSGADPSGMLQRFAEKMEKKPGEKLHMISLGQGQGPIAEMLISNSRKTGDWVCLQNCHLASSWMVTMERIIERFIPEREEIHPEFRLWLTSLPSAFFPVPVLQNGIKITNEPPKGVRANLLQSYANIAEDYIENCTKRAVWKKLVFSIAFFHAVIQERRKFGPLGWNVKYDFNSSDLECAMATLHMFLEEQDEIPWPALLYVTGEITYGGRVTDDLDRRCLLSTLRRYYDPAVLSDSYPFTPNKIYMSPPEGMYSFYVEYIKSLPSAEGPDVFGMHENANLTFQLQETSKVINTVLSIQPRATTTSAGGKTPDEIVADLASSIQEKMPGPLVLDPESPALTLGPDGQLTSLAVVLVQEAERFNKLVKVLAATLIELQRAIKGLVVMSAELEAMFNNFLNNQVPGLWQAVAYPSLKPLSSWIEDFHRRMDFMSAWIKEGTPKCFWLPGLFFPQGFMTGALQTHARKYQIPIDTLNFGFKVMTMEDENEIEAAPEDGIYISGLYLDGAMWDRKHRWLTEALPGKMYSPLPVVHFTPVVNYKIPADEYQCPLYKTHVRAGVLTTTGASSNYILNISLRISPETNPDYWVLQGIASLCQTGD